MTRTQPTGEARDRRAGRLALPLRRVFWFCLLLTHGAAFPSMWLAFQADGGVATHMGLLIRFVGMSISAGFFLLKIFDVPGLRFNPGWRSWIAIILIVSVLHVGVVDRAMGGDFTFDPSHLGLVFFIGSLLLADAMLRWLRHVLAPLMPLRLRREPRWRTCLGRAWETRLTLVPQTGASVYAAPRAPPHN